MGDGLDQLFFSKSVLKRLAEMKAQLLRPIEGYECGDGDEAAVALGEFGSLPYVSEQHLTGQLRKLGCEFRQRDVGGLRFRAHALCSSL
jgi:hypothetical protein